MFMSVSVFVRMHENNMHIQFTSSLLVMSRTNAVNIAMDMSATITAVRFFPASFLPRLCWFCCYLCHFLLFSLTVFADFVFGFSSYPESRELNSIHCDNIVPDSFAAFCDEILLSHTLPSCLRVTVTCSCVMTEKVRRR